jgi:streptogramin lyase
LSNLVLIDPDTGARIATIGEITDDPVFGGAMAIADLAAQPGTDRLFGVRWNGDGAGRAGRIYSIDRFTGLAALVGDTGTCNEGGLAFTPDGTLYFTGSSSCFAATNALHVLNPATGAIISSIPLQGLWYALAVRPTDGTLFTAAGDLLYEIDPATGVEVLWGQTGNGAGLADLAFR